MIFLTLLHALFVFVVIVPISSYAWDTHTTSFAGRK